MPQCSTAIDLHQVTKRFRRYDVVKSHGSLKTTVVDLFRGRRTKHTRLTDPNRFDVIRDVNIHIARGETVGLIGRNGAGKSTLLKLIAGIYRPDTGVITSYGRMAALIELGAGFHPDFTGRENIEINAMILGLSRRELRQRFDAIVAYGELQGALDAPVRTYSTGMFARLAFSVAINVKPDILLIDEVLAVGDEAFQSKCLATIQETIAAREQTTLIVSHDMDMIEQLCERVIVFDPPNATCLDDVAQGIAAFRELLHAGTEPSPA